MLAISATLYGRIAYALSVALIALSVALIALSVALIAKPCTARTDWPTHMACIVL